MRIETPLFRIRDLEIRYDSRRPGHPDLSVSRLDLYEGETVFLTGPNGSGKSTFLKALNALVEVHAGSLEYRGGASAQRRETVYLHQHPYIFAGSVEYNTGFACRAARLDAAETKRRSEKAMTLVGLAGYSGRRHRQLSGGEAQRVALARVIASEAKVFLLDEPTASADAESARLISLALRTLASQGRTLLVATHDPSFILDFSEIPDCRKLAFRRGELESDTVVSEPRERAKAHAIPESPGVLEAE